MMLTLLEDKTSEDVDYNFVLFCSYPVCHIGCVLRWCDGPPHVNTDTVCVCPRSYSPIENLRDLPQGKSVNGHSLTLFANCFSSAIAVRRA